MSCNGSPVGHLTPSQCVLFHCGLIRDGASSGIRHLGPPVASVVLCSAVVVSCRKEGAERLTAGGVFRQDPCRVWNHDACQLCKAGLSPRISLEKEELKQKKSACPRCSSCLSSARLGFQCRFDFGRALKTAGFQNGAHREKTHLSICPEEA